VQRIQEAIADDSIWLRIRNIKLPRRNKNHEAHIVELEDKLARADVIDVSKLFGDTIKFGLR